MHPDRLRAPLFWFALPFAGGLAAREQFGPIEAAWQFVLASLILGVGAAFAARSRSLGGKAGWGLLVGAGCGCAGWAYSVIRTPPPAGGGIATDREAVLCVRVIQAFSSRPGAKTWQGIGVIEAAPSYFPPLRGQRVYYSLFRRESRLEPRRGGVYEVRGVASSLRTADAAAGFDAYLAGAGVAVKLQRGAVEREIRRPALLQRAAARSADYFADLLQRGLERRPDLAAVYKAMLLGKKASLDPRHEQAFMQTGTFHIFSVSGLHVGVIASAIQSVLLLLRVTRPARVVAGLVALWFYVEVAGANPPAVRAFLMVAFFLTRGLFGLPGNSLAALAAAGTATLLVDPRQLFSAGFQLSYLVVASLVLMGMPLADRWQKAWRPFAMLPEFNWGWWRKGVVWVGRAVIGSLAMTCAALLGSTPATILFFGLFTPAGLVANLLVIPLSSLAIVSGFLSILSGLVHAGPWSVLFNRAAGILIIALGWIAERGAELPLASFPAEFRAGWMAPLALAVPPALMMLGAGLRWRRSAGGFWLPTAGVAVLLACCIRLGRG